jgi:hypothetical protein
LRQIDAEGFGAERVAEWPNLRRTGHAQSSRFSVPLAL